MKKAIMLMIVFILLLCACTGSLSSPSPTINDGDILDENTPNEPPKTPEHGDSNHYSYSYIKFEEAILEFSTDIVVAQYIGQKPFGKKAIEFEFAVKERILGDAPDRILVYAEPVSDADIDVVGSEREINYRKGHLSFDTGTEYMLVLGKSSSPYLKTPDDAYSFIRDIVVDLNDPSKSTMYSGSMSQHSKVLEFSKSSTREEIVSYVEEVVRGYDPPRMDYIKSDKIEDAINGSSNIWVIEISNPLRLSDEVPETDWMDTDIYYCTVVEILKGGIKAEDEIAVIFFADTVKTGETYVVAVEPLEEGGSWYRFASKNSLFQKDQYDEIKSIMGDVKS